IEFARNGGRINTDAIDNAGGVDSSDHEVNLKILLNQQVAAGILGESERNALLESMTEEVAELVLRHNYGQSQILSLGETQAASRLNDHRRLIHELENAGRLNRELEQLPSDEELDALAREGQGLSRPETAVLLAHSKLWLCDQLIDAGIADDGDLLPLLRQYFPSAVREGFGTALEQHPLRTELLATHLTNQLCNRLGETFVSYLQSETRCSALEALRACVSACRILGADDLWRGLEAIEREIDDDLFRAQLGAIQDLIERTALWLLRHTEETPASVVVFADDIRDLLHALPDLLDEEDAQAIKLERERLLVAGLQEPLATSLARLPLLYPLLSLLSLSRSCGQMPATTAGLYFALEKALQLKPMRHSIALLPERDLWQRKARATLAREVDGAQLQLCRWILECTDDGAAVERLAQWQSSAGARLDNLYQTFAEIRSCDTPDLAMLSVAVRELGSLQAP
ncbi:MAG: NAD-glutamate dehydrogenase, partial [Oceanospirillaceae bacterium]|nr:NAD-glutamate dehydrogenase [Oceanospirillaceae bacterium]